MTYRAAAIASLGNSSFCDAGEMKKKKETNCFLETAEELMTIEIV